MAGTELVPVRWPVGLRDRVRAVAGHRGVTAFVVAAVEEKLAGAIGTRPEDPESAEALPLGAAGGDAKVIESGRAVPTPARSLGGPLRDGPEGCWGFRPQPGSPLRCECGQLLRAH